MGEILTIGNGKDYKHLKSGNVPVFGTGGYMTSVNDFLIDGETVCIGRKGTINRPIYHSGKIWTVDTLFFTHSFVNALPKLVYYVFQNINWMKYNEASGVPSLSKSTIEQIEVKLPLQSEQNKIAHFLSLLDERIATQSKIIEDLNTLKISISRKIFSQNLRFKDDKENDFPEWTEKKLGEVLEYEQPTNYLVLSTEYDDSFAIPVVTAGKTFILGYTNEVEGIFDKERLPVIIFDDFTTASQFVDFQFKAKSSAMKILNAKANNNIKFIYEAMQMIKYEIGGHGRHWISVFSNIEINLPCIAEQNKIANLLSSFDTKIDIENRILQKLEEQKKYFLANLFI